MKCTFHFIHRWMSDYDIAHSLHSNLQHLETKFVRLKIWYAISHKNSLKMFLHLNAAYLTCMKWIKLLILIFNYIHHVYQHLLQSLPISLLQTKRIRTYMKNDPRWRIADRGPRSRTAVRAESVYREHAVRGDRAPHPQSPGRSPGLVQDLQEGSGRI